MGFFSNKNVLLTVELVPSSTWYNNVRKYKRADIWDTIRKKCYKRANYKCEICGESGINQGFRHPVECHEIWEFDDRTHTQILKGFIALCPLCHKVKHYGYAELSGFSEMAFQHLMRVNEFTEEQAVKYLEECKFIWQKRSMCEWKLNLDYADEYIKE